MDACTLTSTQLTATISPQGAELHSLKTANGDELIWQADPAFWARHAPHLFPIVGRLADDTLVHEGKGYSMGQHGFARDMCFEVEASSDSDCTLVLKDNEQTSEKFPFEFELRINFILLGNTLAITYTIRNPGDTALPCSIGAHPAFNWPIPGNDSRDAHSISFAETETCHVNRLDAGLLMSDGFPWPWLESNNLLQLDDSLFEPDAMIFTDHHSREVRYSGEHGPTIVVHFTDFPHLGIWSVPGAGFVCIEPWQGHSSPVDFKGEFSDKPGIVKIAPGAEQSWAMTIRIED